MRVITDFEQNTPEWLAWREGKISGTKLGKVFAKSRKTDEIYDTSKRNLMYYQILAERLCVNAKADVDSENAMARGHELESEAIKATMMTLGLAEDSGKSVGGWEDETDEAFIESPDFQEDSDNPTWAMEVKCLSAAKHIAAIIEDKPPHWAGDESMFAQRLNYFLTSNIDTLYFSLYNPDFDDPKLWVKIFTFKRAGLAYEIERMIDVRSEIKNQLIADLKALKG